LWYYKGEVFDEAESDNWVGFVYIITNKLNDKKYIGKKLFKFSRIKSVKGKRKKVKVDSDWKTYYGSNAELLKDVSVHGEENFHREILLLCNSKGSANYHEMKYQILNEVLESGDWYNDQIRCRVHRSHIKK